MTSTLSISESGWYIQQCGENNFKECVVNENKLTYLRCLVIYTFYQYYSGWAEVVAGFKTPFIIPGLCNFMSLPILEEKQINSKQNKKTTLNHITSIFKIIKNANKKLAGCYNMMIVKYNIFCINKGSNWSVNI